VLPTFKIEPKAAKKMVAGNQQLGNISVVDTESTRRNRFFLRWQRFLSPDSDYLLSVSPRTAGLAVHFKSRFQWRFGKAGAAVWL
jgi:hypothetical protein